MHRGGQCRARCTRQSQALSQDRARTLHSFSLQEELTGGQEGGKEKEKLFFPPIFSYSANKARPSKGENAQHGEREGEETWIVEKAHTGLPGGDGHSTHDGGDCPSSASRLTTSKSAMSATGSSMRCVWPEKPNQAW